MSAERFASGSIERVAFEMDLGYGQKLGMIVFQGLHIVAALTANGSGDLASASRSRHRLAQGRFTLATFVYDAEANVYRCPAGAVLKPVKGYKTDAGGQMHIRYACLRSVCGACPVRQQCLTAKAQRRDIYPGCTRT